MRLGTALRVRLGTAPRRRREALRAAGRLLETGSQVILDAAGHRPRRQVLYFLDPSKSLPSPARMKGTALR